MVDVVIRNCLGRTGVFDERSETSEGVTNHFTYHLPYM